MRRRLTDIDVAVFLDHPNLDIVVLSGKGLHGCGVRR